MRKTSIETTTEWFKTLGQRKDKMVLTEYESDGRTVKKVTEIK